MTEDSLKSWAWHIERDTSGLTGEDVRERRLAIIEAYLRSVLLQEQDTPKRVHYIDVGDLAPADALEFIGSVKKLLAAGGSVRT